ncbi:response regulator transcription factor [Erysipelothrix rhusiopathiae]|uniref:Response regulator receiver domain protein n=1 Tax=Erysipelothrix rhusiopathiae ATCC 19414 TaxID=525280 RepID=E7FW08_ERYRH|nr:response regulator transcription factor [Erysipelothrix rhusiopathiae]UPU39020.1 response regulator transcription factor [Erysipelothrix sp. Poltava]AMS10828.1 DNA-binding response regulator [Erysipelothrix rhusiopathiae]AOO66898.1 DNA-binding response regulator [Erysipelothrix rhusiopathiae]AWU41805.1 DNA-binding response regulator [Erysipelothrix rhusiopathiae]EFY09078.1 response regulator receiver domain protein [Erysipelothrix rhusiopathiae ATCC 19414]
MYKIMIIEDNDTIRNELSSFLKKNGYETTLITDFKNVMETFKQEVADCVLLDLSLPEVEGHYLAKEIRKISAVPIIVVTSRNSTMDELMSMNLGADDFITKPYNLQILLARLQSVLRRAYEKNDNAVTVLRGVELDTPRGMVRYMGQEQELTKNELRILSYLIANKGSIVSRQDLMQYLWNTDWFVDDNTLTVNINRLRKKLEEIGIVDFIETKRGMGYTIHEN